MGVNPKISKIEWKRTTSAGCVSCSGQLEITITNDGDAGSIRILIEGTGVQLMDPKIYDQPFNINKAVSNTWTFKVPYWSNKSPSVTAKTGPAGSVAWTDQKTVIPTA
ncbi:MAG: hypothetical protein LUP94_02425 [Candidatus Methanomethylicus sp.]|nr:hypothetical protein [Candidatus Methanomethylicus sp.]